MNHGATRPEPKPSNRYGMISQLPLSRNNGIWYRGPGPRNPRTVSVAITDANTSGPKISIAMEPSTISATKTAPEIGALYAEAMPAAAPQPTSNRNRGAVHRCKRPASDATIAESWTSGPSRPMDPPEAIVKSAERDFTILWRADILPSPSTTASM